MKAYKKLEEYFCEYTALKEIDSLLNWDSAVLMPKKAINQRARQSSILGKKMHQVQTSPKVRDLIEEINKEELNEWQLANLRIIKHMYLTTSSVPQDLFIKKKNQVVKTEAIWVEAKKNNDFKMVEPYLTELLNIVRETADAKSEKMGLEPYDALIDEFSPQWYSKDIDILFDDLAVFLPNLMEEIIEHQGNKSSFEYIFPVKDQKKLNIEVAQLLGFDQTRGRLDISAHPFTSGKGNDVRITTRYNERDFFESIQGVIHEVGHALFHLNAPQEMIDQPVGYTSNLGMAIHESQSISVEMQMGRSLEFFKIIATLIKKRFGRAGKEFSAESLYHRAIGVKRSLIRIDADEVTYPLHIIFRYRLEKDLISGKLQVKDLPEAWNEKMKEVLGIAPPNDTLGCMQDVHWYFGCFGYFPSYAIGEILAAQFVSEMKEDIPDVFDRVATGDITGFTGWLNEKVHSKACLYTPVDLVKNVTGKKMNTEYLKRHLTKRYLEAR